MKLLSAVAVLFVGAALCCTAEQATDQKKQGHDFETLLKSRVSPIKASISYANWTYFTSVTIPANGYIYLDTNIDFSSSTEVSISVLSANPDVVNLIIAPHWTSNGVPYFMPSTTASGNSFDFSDSGAAYFTVSGSQLRVFFYNRSSATMTYKAVYIYASSL